VGFPEAKPAWDPNKTESQDNLHRYKKALMTGLKKKKSREYIH
jgi:hypothetical protein